jgi:autotransporter-associated beta strand protein
VPEQRKSSGPNGYCADGLFLELKLTIYREAFPKIANFLVLARVPLQTGEMKSPVFLLSILLISLLFTQFASAGSATWSTNPATNDWNTAANWTPPTVPDGPQDVATFSISNQTSVVLNESVELNQIVFDAGASPFTIFCTAQPKPFDHLMMTGTGMINNSGINQTFVTQVAEGVLGVGVIEFHNNATAGSSITFINSGARIGSTVGGVTDFFDSSTAGNATFINEGGSAFAAWGGDIDFYDSASAGNGSFINHGATDMGTLGGFIEFFDTSTADHATFVCNGGEASGRGQAYMYFFGNSTAGSATFTINGGFATDTLGGTLTFLDNSSAGNGTFTINGGTASGADGGVMYLDGQAEDASFTVNGTEVNGAGAGSLHIGRHVDLRHDVIVANGGTAGAQGGQIFIEQFVGGGHAQFKLFGNSLLDISAYEATGLVTGSIEGEGTVFLGAKTLSVGRNHLDTVFSGIIRDGRGQRGPGSLHKIGHGTLTLTGANLYTGPTVVNGGKLLINNASGSGVGTGILQVNTGTLGGNGTIAGIVTVGTGRASKPSSHPVPTEPISGR